MQTVICKRCGREKKHCAKGLCESCYGHLLKSLTRTARSWRKPSFKLKYRSRRHKREQRDLTKIHELAREAAEHSLGEALLKYTPGTQQALLLNGDKILKREAELMCDYINKEKYLEDMVDSLAEGVDWKRRC